MAFEKIIYKDDNTGVSASYWKICQINSNWMKENIYIRINGYLNKEMRDERRSEILFREYLVDGALFNQYFGIDKLDLENSNIVKKAYECLRVLPNGDFVDAIDV